MRQAIKQEKAAGRSLEEVGFKAGLEEKKAEENIYLTFNKGLEDKQKRLKAESSRIEELEKHLKDLEEDRVDMLGKYTRLEEDLDLHYKSKIRLSDSYIVDLSEKYGVYDYRLKHLRLEILRSKYAAVQ